MLCEEGRGILSSKLYNLIFCIVSVIKILISYAIAVCFIHFSYLLLYVWLPSNKNWCISLLYFLQAHVSSINNIVWLPPEFGDAIACISADGSLSLWEEVEDGLHFNLCWYSLAFLQSLSYCPVIISVCCSYFICFSNTWTLALLHFFVIVSWHLLHYSSGLITWEHI